MTPAVLALLLPALQIADMSRIVDLQEPAISPDAGRIAIVEIAQNLAKASDENRLLLVNARTGAIRVLVRGSDVAVPRWSPDGRGLTYLATVKPNGIRQLFLREPDGRVRRLTQSSGDVIDDAWSPDGTQIAYVAADPQPHSTYFFAGDNDYTATALTPPDHLWVVPAGGGRSRRLTSGSWTIAPTDPGGIFSPQIAWSRDGRAIAYARVENTFSGDDEYSTIWQIPLTGGTAHKLTAHPEVELAPAYSPDGVHLAYWYAQGGDFTAQNTVRLLSGADDRALAADFDRNVSASLWYPDGRHMLLCAVDGTQTYLWASDLDGRRKQLSLGDLHPVCDPYSSSTFDAGISGAIARDGTTAFVAETSKSAKELYVLAPGSSAPRRLTHLNDFLRGIALGAQHELDWTGPDGWHENGVVTMPPNAVAGTRYPIVLLVHGGPGLSSTRDFAYEFWPQAQAIASHGYVVLQPNYRGSDNSGNAYMTAIVRDTVAGPSADVMAGLAALEREPYADGSRVAVSGWSYGGELTSWLIGHYHTWRAAVSGAAVNSEFDEYDTSTSNVQDRYPLGTSPYVGDGWRVYADNSPITYYAQISTPTLIWGTTLDPVVPISQQYALFHALTDNHVPVRFAVFPASTHGPADPQQTADLTRLWLDWLDRYMGP